MSVNMQKINLEFRIMGRTTEGANTLTPSTNHSQKIIISLSNRSKEKL